MEEKVEEAFHPRRTFKVRARRPRRLKQEDSSKPGPPPLPEDRVKLTVTVLGVAGRGCFGEVFKCLVKSSSSSSRKERVQAMKVVPASRRSSRRELEVLRAVGREDENVAGMNHFFYLGGGGGDGEKMLHLLSDYASCGTLFDELQHKDKGLPRPTCRRLTTSLLKGLDYLHRSALICHRDIKPSNLLLSGSTGDGDGDTGDWDRLRICDFGSAIFLSNGGGGGGGDLSPYVCSRYYRSPELLLGRRRHGAAVDLWAAACVAAEMRTGAVLLRGDDSSIEQLVETAHLLGPVSPSESDRLASSGVDRGLLDLVSSASASSAVAGGDCSSALEDRLRNRLDLEGEEGLGHGGGDDDTWDETLIRLMLSCLTYCPEERPSASDTLENLL